MNVEMLLDNMLGTGDAIFCQLTAEVSPVVRTPVRAGVRSDRYLQGLDFEVLPQFPSWVAIFLTFIAVAAISVFLPR